MTRGCKRDVEEMVKYLETRAFDLPYTDSKGKKGSQLMSGLLQPIQLWSYVFPEDSKDAVLTSLRFDKENIKRWSASAKMKALTTALRIGMGGSKIPKFDTSKCMVMPIGSMKNISIIPIGVKADSTRLFPDGTTRESI